jgi:hypothetical protein
LATACADHCAPEAEGTFIRFNSAAIAGNEVTPRAWMPLIVGRCRFANALAHAAFAALPFACSALVQRRVRIALKKTVRFGRVCLGLILLRQRCSQRCCCGIAKFKGTVGLRTERSELHEQLAQMRQLRSAPARWNQTQHAGPSEKSKK